MEADLLRCGYVMADVPHRVSWRAVKALATHAGRDSAFSRAQNGYRETWGAAEYLLADLFDAFRAANFKDPRPYPRPSDPGVVAARSIGPAPEQDQLPTGPLGQREGTWSVGGAAIPMNEFSKWWNETHDENGEVVA